MTVHDRPDSPASVTSEHPPRSSADWHLKEFSRVGYDKGRGRAVQAAWFTVLNVLFMAWWCPTRLRPPLLRLFGARVGRGVFIRHRVRVLWPWKLDIGDNTWIGEDVWLLNLEPITIGSDVCLSQGVFLCTGSHNRHSRSFEYDNAPIVVGNQSWVAAQALVLRGVTIRPQAIVGARAVVSHDVSSGMSIPCGARW